MVVRRRFANCVGHVGRDPRSFGTKPRDEAILLLAGDDVVGRAIQLPPVLAVAWAVSMGHECQHAQRGDSWLSAFHRRKRSVGLLLRDKPIERPVDCSIQAMPFFRSQNFRLRIIGNVLSHRFLGCWNGGRPLRTDSRVEHKHQHEPAEPK